MVERKWAFMSKRISKRITVYIILLLMALGLGYYLARRGLTNGIEQPPPLSQEEPPEEPNEPEDPIRKQIEAMSLEEKVGQLVIVGIDGPEFDDNSKRLIEEYHVGGFIFFKRNLQNSRQMLELLNSLKRANAVNKVPLFLSIDAVSYTHLNYPYLLNTDYANYNGVTENLVYQGKVLLKAHPSGKRYSHCTGITFEVFFKAMQERNKKLGLSPDDFNGMTFDELFDFVMSWYVADGNKAVQNVAKAVEKYGIGRRITNWEEARAGDFMDLSRENNTGHTVVFINWLRDKNGKIIGLNYWSSQESTGGISYKEEYFNIPNAKGQKYGNVMSDYLFIARILPVRDYR